MKKLGKTLFGLLMLTALITPTAIPAAAADDAPVIDWTVDFTENKGTAAAWNTWSNSTMLNASKQSWDNITLNGGDFQILDKAYDKADGSGSLTNTEALYMNTRNESKNQTTMIRFATDKTLEAGQTAVISFDYALEDDSSKLSRYIAVNGSTSSSMQLLQTCGDSIRISDGTSVRKYNSQSGGYVGMKWSGGLADWRWHHFEYRLGICEDGTYVVIYLNGSKLDEYKNTISITDFKDLTFSTWSIPSDGTSIKTAIDNISFKVLNEVTGPVVDEKVKTAALYYDYETPSTGKTNQVYNETNVAAHEFVGGKFGKSSDDTVLRLYNKDVAQNSGEDAFHWFNTAWDQTLSYGDTEDFELKFAYEDVFAGLTLWSREYGWTNSVEIKPDGRIIAYRTEKGKLNLEPGKWYKLNLITTPSSETESKFTYKILLDNRLICDGEYNLANKAASWAGHKNMRIGYYWTNAGLKSGETAIYNTQSTYIDDIRVTNYTAADLENTNYAARLAHEPVTVSHNNSFINKYISNDKRLSSYITPTITAKEYKDGLKVSNAESVKLDVSDENELMYGKSAEITTLSGEKLYLTPNAERKTITDASISVNGIDGLFEAGANDFTKFEYLSSVSGREDDDYGAFITITDKTGETDTAPAFMQGTGVTAPTKLTTSVYVGEDSAAIARLLVNYTSNNGGAKQNSVLAFDGKGNLRLGQEGKVIGKATLNGWNLVEVVTYPGSANADIRLNGKLVADYAPVFQNTVDYYERFKWETPIFGVNGGSSKYGFANIKLVSGAYDSSDFAGEVSIEITSDDFTPYNAANVLYVSDLADASEIYNEFENVCNIYADNSMSEVSDELADGGVVVVSENGVYKYYTVKTSEPGLETLGITYNVNGNNAKYNFEKGTLNVSLAFEGTGTKNVDLYIARFEGEKLAEVVKVSDVVTGTDSADAEFNVTDTTGKIKVIATDNNFAPLCDVLVIPGE